MGTYLEIEEKKKERIVLKGINVPVIKVISLAVRSSIKKPIFSKTGKNARQLSLNIEKTVIQLSKSGGTSLCSPLSWLRIILCIIVKRCQSQKNIFLKAMAYNKYDIIN